MAGTTTDHLRVKPDFYHSKETCLASLRVHKNSNPRYKQFNQSVFHAGDEEQFETYRDATNGQVCIPDINLDNNIFREFDFSPYYWEGYKNLPATCVIDTFRYMFNKFKKGIFIKIKDNQVDVFLPFSKVNYVNEWGDRIKVDPSKYKNIPDFIRYINKMENRNYNDKKINRFPDTWYGNNCLLRYEFPVGEGESAVPNTSDMFTELCKNRTLPDIELFINRRDFPILKRDYTEPYNHIFDSDSIPLLSHSHAKYCPILGWNKTDKYADIPIPTWEDWARVSSQDNKYFIRTCKDFDSINIPWNDKIPTAVFRGGSTGCGVTIETNPRLKVSFLSKNTPIEDGIPLLDAGITNWNLRPRKIEGNRYLQTIDIHSIPFTLVDRLTPSQQAKYKYIINIDGHVSAFRLSLELDAGSVILLVESDYKMWFRDFLVPYVHYVPVKRDLSDLFKQIRWCREHDNECEGIANNAKDFYKTYLTKEGIFDYLQKLIYELKQETNIYLYNYITPLSNQINKEVDLIKQKLVFPDTNKTIKDINIIPNQKRTYSLLQGVQWVINMILEQEYPAQFFLKCGDMFNAKLSKVRSYTMANFPLAIKQTVDHSKIKESIHETFVGLYCINNIIKFIPNFTYIFGLYTDNDCVNVITEKISGMTLDKYIDSPDFTIKNYLFILLQLMLALQVAQNNYCLTHYDLYPWNIVIQQLNTPTTFDYKISYNKVIRVTTNIIPVIIDYGKSHVIYSNKHYGLINMYKTSTIQDVISILVTTIHLIMTKYRLPKHEFFDILTLSNFISNTKYCPGTFKTSYDLKNFLHEARKYSVMISTDKYELETKTPIDLFDYIMSNFSKYKLTIQTVTNIQYTMNKGNSRQVFDYILSNDIQEQSLTYYYVFQRLKQCSIPQPDNLFFMYYTAQQLEDNLISVYNIMIDFLIKNNINRDKYQQAFNNCIKYLYKIYKNKIDTGAKDPIEYVLIEPGPFEQATYNPETFLLPALINHKINDITYYGQDLTEFKEMIEQTLLNNSTYKLTDQDRTYYIDNFKILLNINSVITKNNIANGQTLRSTAIDIYTLNIEKIEKIVPVEIGNCSVAKQYLDIYKDIVI